MKKLLAFVLPMFCWAVFAACEANKAPTDEEDKKEEVPETVELYVTSCETGDEKLCDRNTCSHSDCGIEDYYFTKKGNVIQRNSCLHEESALWIVGKYRVSDSGMVCQMEKVYIVPLKYNEDMSPGETDYNAGQYTYLQNQEPYLLQKSSCPGIRFTKQYNEMQRKNLSSEGRTVFGRMYYEDKDWAANMIAELKKVKAFADL